MTFQNTAMSVSQMSASLTIPKFAKVIIDILTTKKSIFNLVVKRDHFASLDIKETFKSAETELRDIIYQPENQSELFKNLKNKYDLPEDTACQIRLYYSGGDIYGITIQIKAQEKTVEIDLILSKK